MTAGSVCRRAAPACRGSPEIPNAVPLFGRFVEVARFGTDGIVFLPPDAVLRNETSVTADGKRVGGGIVDHAVAVVGAEPKTVAAQRDDAVLYEAFVAERVVENEDAPHALADAAYRSREVVFRREPRSADTVGVELFPKVRQGADNFGAGSDLLLKGRYGRRSADAYRDGEAFEGASAEAKRAGRGGF